MNDELTLDVLQAIENYIDAGYKLKVSEINTLINYFHNQILDMQDW